MTSSLFKVKALYDFEAKEDDDLGFPAGQIIDVTEEVDDNWLEGKYTTASGDSRAGIFPREFVEKYEPERPVRPSRPTRPKQESAPAAAAAPQVPVAGAEEADAEEEPPLPPIPIHSRPSAPSANITAASFSRDADEEEARSPPVAVPARSEPPPAPKPAPAEPAAVKKAPPPVATKSSAFRDRIAAFNQSAAPPIAPIVPGGPKPTGTAFVKKAFVAPPPSSNSYIPPPKVEPVHRPYMRDEDPEIKRRQEEDHAAAEAAGLTGDAAAEHPEEDDDAPKPTSLKERIARLQQQQLEQAQRRADGGVKKEKKPPAKKPSESSEQALDPEPEGEALQQERGGGTARQSVDIARDRPPVPTAQRRPQEPMSPGPAAPEHELVSDGNEADHSAAGETTEDDAGTIGPDDSDERHVPTLPRAPTAPEREADVADEDDTAEDAEDNEEDSMDEETRRRMELRERMAKMSGGMSMAGMFGGGMPMPGMAPKKRTTKDKKPSEDSVSPSSPPPPQQRIPIIPVPGLARVQSPESELTPPFAETDEGAAGDAIVGDEEQPIAPPRRSMTQDRGPPPIPKDSRPVERGAPPPIPNNAMPTPRPPAPESRPVPPPPPGPLSPGPGSESDDEASMHRPISSADESGIDTPGPFPARSATGGAPPVPSSVPHSENKRTSYFANESSSATADKRASRIPPPIPGSPVVSARPPPPPPPTQTPSRSATQHEDDEDRGESDYEGDYDTDIASNARHKDALKAHVREPSLDDSTTADETSLGSPPAPPTHAVAPRGVPPPPPPSQAPPRTRQSMDAPRAPPPLPPPTSPRDGDDPDYDPYRYDSQQAQRAPPPPPPGGVAMDAPPIPPREPEPVQESSADDMYAREPTRPSMDRAPPPPPVHHNASQPARVLPRQSLDVQRSNTTARRSMDQPRPSGEHGQIATEIELNEDTPWWTAAQPLPPVLESRRGIDLLSECEESTTSKRGGRTTISKDIYILFMDYSQTIITALFDSKEPLDVQIEQKHLPPPARLRQDQLEAYWQRFGRKIAEAANSLGHSKKETIVANGSPVSFVSELIRGQEQALQPIGTRAYGSLVYANLANASTMQFDEIRPGDIVTLRNARFEGTHGAMKHKYRQEYGASHVAVVEEWDGTRRSIRAWEQGREEKKDKGVRSEKFRLGDLRSGEVKVWRVVGRDWVNWESGS